MNSLVSRIHLFLAVLAFNAGGLSVGHAQQVGKPTTLVPLTGQANLTHFQRHNASTSDRRCHFLMKTQYLTGGSSLRLFSTNSQAASNTSPAPTDYREQVQFPNTMTMAGANRVIDAAGTDSTSDLIMVGNDMHLVYNTLVNGQCGVRYVKLTYRGGASSTTASYWDKVVDVAVITGAAPQPGKVYNTYIRPAIAIYPDSNGVPDEIWVTCMQVSGLAGSPTSIPVLYDYQAYKAKSIGTSPRFSLDLPATKAFRGASFTGKDRLLKRAETRSIRPLACQGLLALLYTDARNIDQFENAKDQLGSLPAGYADTAPVSFYLTYRKSDGTWEETSKTPIYSRFVAGDDGKATPFVKQFDDEGAQFSAVATPYTDVDGLLAPAIHIVTNDGDRSGFYERYEPGVGMTEHHDFPDNYPTPDGADYSMQAAYLHIAYDPDPASMRLYATFSVNDNRSTSDPKSKALLTFTSLNGGSDWNDNTPDVMVTYSPNKDSGEPRFEIPAIIGSPHVFLQQIDLIPDTPGMPHKDVADFTFFSYSLPDATLPLGRRGERFPPVGFQPQF